MHVRIPKLDCSLPLEPFPAHEQTEDDTSLVLLSTCFFRGSDNPGRDDGAVWSGNLLFLKRAGYHGFNLMLCTCQTETVTEELVDLLRRKATRVTSLGGMAEG